MAWEMVMDANNLEATTAASIIKWSINSNLGKIRKQSRIFKNNASLFDPLF